MLKILKANIERAKFYPGLLAFFINNNFLIRRPLYKSIKRHSPEIKGNLLDFGCGTKPYKQLFAAADKYVGVDYYIEGRSNHAYVDTFYDGKVIPFADDYFDSILCTEVLEHVFNIEELLKEMNRVLKPGGKALVTTPFMWEEHEMPYDFARYTTPALIHLYKKSGFTIITHDKTGNYIELIAQFQLNYIKNILPQSEILRQALLLPFIIFFNFTGLIFGFLLPKNKMAYFNNVFLIQKV